MYRNEQVNNRRLSYVVGFLIAVTNLAIPNCARSLTHIGSIVWNDLNANGIRDPGEPGINGITLTITNCNPGSSVFPATATTFNNGVTDGYYEFSFGACTNVFVTIQLPSGYTITQKSQGSDPLLDSDVDPTTGQTDCIFYSVCGSPCSLVPTCDLRHSADVGLLTINVPIVGTGTVGYWKNHPQSWPVEQITLGGVTFTKADALSQVMQPSRGDKSIDLAKQLLAAELNVLSGADSSCVQSAISDADGWLVTHPIGSGVTGSSDAWEVANPYLSTLDDYNNGLLCAPHRD